MLAALLPLTLGPAQQATCHRFSVWKYPHAQRCSTVVAVNDKPTPPAKPKVELDPRWFVNKLGNLEVVLTPGMTDEEGRAIAIDALKEVMGP